MDTTPHLETARPPFGESSREDPVTDPEINDSTVRMLAPIAIAIILVPIIAHLAHYFAR